MTKTPREIAEERLNLAEAYSRGSELFANMIKFHAEFYRKNREKFKSDTACEREWELTEQGIEMTTLKLKLKSLEKRMSALNTMLRLQENEAKGLY